MKTKLFILLIFLTGCSNKQQVIHYLILETNYRTLSGNADFVIKDQQGVLEYGLVSLFDNASPSTREATEDDKRKAVELSYSMPTLKTFCDDAAKHCSELEKLYKQKSIFKIKDRQADIKYYRELLSIDESSILKVTGGLDPKEYIEPLIPKDLRIYLPVK